MRNSSPPPDLFKPEMPRIPGVNDNAAPSSRWKVEIPALIAAAILTCAMLFIGGVMYLLRGRAASGSAALTQTMVHAAESTFQPPAPISMQRDSSVRLSDLAKPWAAKEFTFVNPDTHVDLAAMVIRLPGMSATRSDAYWAFSLDAPYESCKLAYVTDLGELASRYHYRAVHPMVASACDGTVYDPLRMGTTPAGAWVRGEVAQGMGIRPPISIEVRIQGRSIVADRIE
jgi:hypothetical protein